MAQYEIIHIHFPAFNDTGRCQHVYLLQKAKIAAFPRNIMLISVHFCCSKIVFVLLRWCMLCTLMNGNQRICDRRGWKSISIKRLNSIDWYQ